MRKRKRRCFQYQNAKTILLINFELESKWGPYKLTLCFGRGMSLIVFFFIWKREIKHTKANYFEMKTISGISMLVQLCSCSPGLISRMKLDVPSRESLLDTIATCSYPLVTKVCIIGGNGRSSFLMLVTLVSWYPNPERS